MYTPKETFIKSLEHYLNVKLNDYSVNRIYGYLDEYTREEAIRIRQEQEKQSVLQRKVSSKLTTDVPPVSS
jgi:hypothetical protein